MLPEQRFNIGFVIDYQNKQIRRRTPLIGHLISAHCGRTSVGKVFMLAGTAAPMPPAGVE
jgi:hypothetical protein